LQGLMAKADTGVAGPVVAELAYRNDYLAVRGQAQFAEDAWRRNRCQETPPTPPAAAAPPANAKAAHRSNAGTAVYYRGSSMPSRLKARLGQVETHSRFSLLFAHDLGANALLRLSRWKTGAHFSGSCARPPRSRYACQS